MDNQILPQITIRQRDALTFDIDSFTNSDAYRVTLGARPSCSCPHFTYRLSGTHAVCKHITCVQEFAEKQARAERFEHLRLLAGSVEDGDLPKLIAKYTGAPGKGEILLSLLCEQFDREQLARQPVEMPAPAPSLEVVLVAAKRWGQQQRDAFLRSVFA